MPDKDRLHAAFIQLDKKTRTWMELDGDRIYNTAGGYQILTSKMKVIARETVESNDWKDLDWTLVRPKMTDPKARGGWLSPTGVWYGCRHGMHETVAWLILKSNGQTVEKTHCHVHEAHGQWPEIWSGPTVKRVTRSQLEWLDSHKYKVEEWDWEALDK